MVDQNKYANAINLEHETDEYESPKLRVIVYQKNCWYYYFIFTVLILEIEYVLFVKFDISKRTVKKI